jgi:hypothetical protein
MSRLFIAWQDPKSREFFPVGQLTYDGRVYRFVYTQGAKDSPSFFAFSPMKDFDLVYECDDLFALFSNRILNRKRPEYPDYLASLGLSEGRDDPMTVLARSGGLRATDPFMVFPCPTKKEDDTYRLYFFCRGLSKLPVESHARIDQLSPGELLYCMPDPQNARDPSAVALRTADPAVLVGYCPQHLNRDLRDLMTRGPDSGRITVERVNREAPFQLRLLCRLTYDAREGVRPCSGHAYEPLVRLAA